MANLSGNRQQMLTFEGQTCSLRRAFTTSFRRLLVIDLNVRRNQPQCSNFAFKVRASKNLRGSCRSRGGGCQGTNGNSSYIFSTEKYTVIIKYSKVWKWCRTFSANFFDPNVRHQACLRSICVEPSGQLPVIGTVDQCILSKTAPIISLCR